jgi:hypothetical protein
LLLRQGAGKVLAFMPAIGDDGGDRREGRFQSTRQQSAGARVRNISSSTRLAVGKPSVS